MNALKFISIAFFMCCITESAWAQGVAVNQTGDPPDGSAMLDVSSISGGVLVPRMTRTQRNAIVSPATGLIVFQTTDTTGFYYYNGSSWEPLGTEVLSLDDLLDGIYDDASLFLGEDAGINDEGENYNTAIGKEALKDNTSGSGNVAVGWRSLYQNQTGQWNIAVGAEALRNNTEGGSNVAIGGNSLLQSQSGIRNIAIGKDAIKDNIDGHYNIAVGCYTLRSNISGDDNIALGDQSLYYNSTGVGNIGIGFRANTWNNTGSYNTIIGFWAGDGQELHSKSGNVYLGSYAGSNDTSDNKLYIDNSSSDTPLIWGDFANDIIAFNADAGIGTHSPVSKLHIIGDDTVRLTLQPANTDNSFVSEIMMKSTFGAEISDHVPRNLAMLKASFDGAGWETATLGFHVAGLDCNTDGGLDPCERMRITSGGNVGIGTTNPEGSAIVDISSIEKGFLPPRMTSSQRTGISSPAAGLLVYQTTSPEGYYYYDGTNWIGISGNTGGAFTTSTCTDFDGNVYPTFQLGDQIWMAENLRVTHFNNGDAIPNVTSNGTWATLTSGAYCWYDNDQSTNEIYGILYNWYAVDDSRGLCPDGWRVPTDSEWTSLTTILGGTSASGGKIKSNSGLWTSPNTNATNSSNFSGLPGGGRYMSGAFNYIATSGNWWSSTEIGADAWKRRAGYNIPHVERSHYSKAYGFSVRCIKD